MHQKVLDKKNLKECDIDPAYTYSTPVLTWLCGLY